MRGILPDGAIDIIGGQVRRLTEKGDKALGLTAVVGILISLWSANGGMKAIFDALNIAYEEDEKRSFVMLNLWSLAFTAGALLFVVLALTGIVVVPAALQVLGLDQKPGTSPCCASPPCCCSSSAPSRCSTATGRAAGSRSGAGLPGAARWPACSG